MFLIRIFRRDGSAFNDARIETNEREISQIIVLDNTITLLLITF